MSRILWVRKESTDRIIPMPPPPSPLLRERIRLHLRRCRDAAPTIFLLDEEALELFVTRYHDIRAQGVADDERLAGFLERKPTNLLRLAMLLFLARPDAKVEAVGETRIGRIGSDCLELASRIIERISDQQTETSRLVESSPVSSNIRYLRRALWSLSAGGTRHVMRSDLLRRVSGKMYQSELNQHLSTLAQGDEVTISAQQRAGKEVTFYGLGPKFTAP